MASDAATAILFPGQGSQAPGMREAVVAHSPELLDLAVARLGEDPFERVEDGTRFAQPALYCAAVAAWIAAGRPRPSYLAGHSLGELAALAASGSVSIADGLRVAIVRGDLMQEAAELESPGGMLALLGDDRTVRVVAGRCGLPIANDNAPGQLVVSGADADLAAAAALAREAKLRAIRLPVAGAFHSAAMRTAFPAFRAALSEIEISRARIPVYSSITVRPFDDVRAALADSLTRPVRWRETLLALHRLGVRRYLETGPGKVLTGLVRRTLPDVEALTISSVEAVHA